MTNNRPTTWRVTSHCLHPHWCFCCPPNDKYLFYLYMVDLRGAAQWHAGSVGRRATPPAPCDPARPGGGEDQTQGSGRRVDLDHVLHHVHSSGGAKAPLHDARDAGCSWHTWICFTSSGPTRNMRNPRGMDTMSHLGNRRPSQETWLEPSWIHKCTQSVLCGRGLMGTELGCVTSPA